MAPEIINRQPVDRRADIFSLGVVLWEALVLARLFNAGSDRATLQSILEGDVPAPSRFRPEVPPELDEICLRAWRRNPRTAFRPQPR